MDENNQKYKNLSWGQNCIEGMKLFGKWLCQATGTALVFIVLTNSCAGISNYQSRNNHPKTAVFTSGYDKNLKSPKLVSRIIDTFMYAPVTLGQNLKGNYVDWYSNATKKEVLKILKEGDHESIVFIGHGSQASFCATDEPLTSEDILDNDIPKINGELVQHTCGKKDPIPPLKEVLLKDSKKGFHFNEVISGPTNYLAAWGRLF